MARAEAKKKKQQVHPTGSKGISMLSFISLAERSMILNKMRSKGLVEEEAVGTGATLRDEERRRREEDLVKLASCLSHFDLGFRPIGGGDTSKAKVPNQKTLGPGGAEEKDGGWVGGAFGGRSMDPEAETGRLVSLSLNVSKALARTRTENKAAIAQALSQSEGTEDFIRL